jgi:two-component system chemotaxis response regulator CheB
MKMLRLVVATPSVVDRSRLARTLARCPGVKVIGQPGDLSETYTLCEAQEPDIVLLARDYVAGDEFRCMASLFQAVGANWIEIADAPRRSSLPPGEAGRAPLVWPDMPADELQAAIRAVGLIRPRGKLPIRPVASRLAGIRPERLILIGASTGGVDALLTVLAGLPANAPPVAVVQHTGQGFSDSLIRLLDRRASVDVKGAADGMVLSPGLVCLAAGTGAHLRVGGGTGRAFRAMLSPGLPVSGHVPSVDELFRSAVPFASLVIAVLLTGMGRDGAAGMLALRQAGAATIAQDEASSVVYGMPRAAWESGAADVKLPLSQIAPEILRLCTQEAGSRTVVR